MSTESDLMRRIAAAKSLPEQAALVTQLDTLRASEAARVQADRDLDWSSQVVDTTFAPVLTHTMHTAATDWLDEVAPVNDEGAHTAMLTEASIWFNKTSSFVKEDAEEFAAQAQGMAQRLASQYGEGAPAAKRAFLDYVAFLLQREGASGLDQIQQLVDSRENPKKTDLPLETMDTFEEPVAPENVGVDEQQASTNAPLLQEILHNNSGAGGGRPSEHNSGPAEVSEPAIPMPSGYHASLVDAPSLAVGHLYDLDQFKAVEAARARVAGNLPEALEEEKIPKGSDADGDGKTHEDDGDDFIERKKKESSRQVVSRTQRTAASGLDQVEQVVDSFERPKPTPLPTEVMFPIIEPFATEHSTEGTGEDQNKKAASRHQADMFSGQGGPAPLVGGPAATTPDNQVPLRPPGTGYDAGYAQGQADAQAGDRPTYADNSSAVPPYVDGYSEGYSDANQNMAPAEQDVPVGAGGDNAQFAGQGQQQPLSVGANRRTAAALRVVSAATQQHPDFRKAFHFAAAWKPGKALVTQGSTEFESGLYAGILTQANQVQQAWADAHAHWGKSDPGLARRIAIQARYTQHLARQQREAGQTVELDTSDPRTNASPTGDTPINGPGTKPPLDGGVDPARAGGAAPYNGAEPYSTPVVPGSHQDRSPRKSPKGENPASAGPMSSDKTSSFRRTVQANVAAQAARQQ